jgi:hypothetical protein
MSNNIKVELSKEDAIALVKGTGGPGAYVHPFDKYGEITGFPNERWVWNDKYLSVMYTHQLYDLYLELKKFKNE